MKIKPTHVTFLDEKKPQDDIKSQEKTITTVNIYDADHPVIVPDPSLEEEARIQRDEFFSRYTFISLVMIVVIALIGCLFIAVGYILCYAYDSGDSGNDGDAVYFIDSP